MMRPYSDRKHLCAEFKRVFKGMELPFDYLMSIVTRSLCIDINRLEAMLIERHGEYGSSMQEFIKEEYGDEAVNMIDSLLN